MKHPGVKRSTVDLQREGTEDVTGMEMLGLICLPGRLVMGITRVTMTGTVQRLKSAPRITPALRAGAPQCSSMTLLVPVLCHRDRPPQVRIIVLRRKGFIQQLLQRSRRDHTKVIMTTEDMGRRQGRRRLVKVLPPQM
ncbi:uncharacterized protein UV8b_04367 [Ustilaginoidea virens]|uniref:Uncharacterized protein n=1 Tax=Ustilaginoidea virens TaxID=1159556 RepID=A0A8E5HRB3_USTVR|nr:uncharacterized protein UV8b_04367 [Ustilaginoidea virens]QUC20126.1 hypothetical protein UV8b_04367 [Ustilaginoidea virens]